MDKYQAQAQFCKGGKDCLKETVAGTWSPVYDQSFVVELENGLRFLSNFKYTLKSDISKDPVHELFSKFEELKSGDYGKFDSKCDQTMVGFVQQIPSSTNTSYSLTQHFVQCFYAKQQTHYDMEKTV